MGLILGIDPGNLGALAFLDPESAQIDIFDMPTFTFTTTRTRTKVDAYGLASILKGRVVSSAYVEEVNASPQMGVVSAFSFGESKGMLLGALAMAGVPLSQVKPNIWKRDLRVPADKKASVMRASQLLPAIADQFRGPRGGTLDGRAEAALLALYGALDQGRAPKVPVRLAA